MLKLSVRKLVVPMLFLASGAAVLLEQAAARPPYRTQMVTQFHLEMDPAQKGSTSCAYCHVGERGGKNWNAFGDTLKRAFSANPKALIPEALYGALKFNVDSDKDGYADALEVFALTLPGDAASKPTEVLADLQKRFDAAGGVEQYNPVKPAEKPAVPVVPVPGDMTPPVVPPEAPPVVPPVTPPTPPATPPVTPPVVVPPIVPPIVSLVEPPPKS